MNLTVTQNKTSMPMLTHAPVVVIWTNWSACLWVMVVQGRIFSSCFAKAFGADFGLDRFDLPMVKNFLFLNVVVSAMDFFHFSSSFFSVDGIKFLICT